MYFVLQHFLPSVYSDFQDQTIYVIEVFYRLIRINKIVPALIDVLQFDDSQADEPS